MRLIYVDHAATTPMRIEVLEAMQPYMLEHFGNPSSIHAFGRKAREGLDYARNSILAHFNAQKLGQLVFTSGGTEADNLALFGVARSRSHLGKHIITTVIEHHAILHTCQQLEQEGFEVTYLPVDGIGRINLEQLKQALRDDTILVSIMYINNEIGSIQPIREIAELLQDHQAYFHTDAVQALGSEQIDLQQVKIDLLSISGHKINAPNGIGALFSRQEVKLQPISFGGSQEKNRRAGTQNVAGAIGFAKAIELAAAEQEQKQEKYRQFKATMLKIFDEDKVRYVMNGDLSLTAPHILNVSFLDVKADIMLMNLDLAGIAASSGSACTAGSLQASHVIQAITDDQDQIMSAIRFSFGYGNTLEEIERVAHTCIDIVNRVK